MTAVVRLQPGASQSRIDGAVVLDDGTRVLRVRVSAPPEKGKANQALIKLLARTWGVPKSSIEIRSGQSERRKTLLFCGSDKSLLTFLEQWLEKQEH